MRLEYIVGCIAALLFAALAPALLVAVLGHSIALAPIAFNVALGHAVLLGLPFAILWPKRWINAISCTGVGFVVGTLPGAVMTWPLNRSMGGNASLNGISTIVAGVPTVAGWLNYIEFLLYLGSLGAFAGFAFWAVLKISGVLELGGVTLPTNAVRRKRSLQAMAPTTSLTVLALLLTGGVQAVPSIMKDRTCHNLLRDGRSGIGPQVGAYLQLNLEDWPRLTKVVEDFGIKHELSFRNSGPSEPGVVYVLGLSLCNEDGTAIQLLDQRWGSSDFASLPRGRGAFVGIYQVGTESGWDQFAREFVAELENNWPGKLAFSGKDGRSIAKPLELQ